MTYNKFIAYLIALSLSGSVATPLTARTYTERATIREATFSTPGIAALITGGSTLGMIGAYIRLSKNLKKTVNLREREDLTLMLRNLKIAIAVSTPTTALLAFWALYRAKNRDLLKPVAKPLFIRGKEALTELFKDDTNEDDDSATRRDPVAFAPIQPATDEQLLRSTPVETNKRPRIFIEGIQQLVERYNTPGGFDAVSDQTSRTPQSTPDRDDEAPEPTTVDRMLKAARLARTIATTTDTGGELLAKFVTTVQKSGATGGFPALDSLIEAAKKGLEAKAGGLKTQTPDVIAEREAAANAMLRSALESAITPVSLATGMSPDAVKAFIGQLPTFMEFNTQSPMMFMRSGKALDTFIAGLPKGKLKARLAQLRTGLPDEETLARMFINPSIIPALVENKSLTTEEGAKIAASHKQHPITEEEAGKILTKALSTTVAVANTLLEETGIHIDPSSARGAIIQALKKKSETLGLSGEEQTLFNKLLEEHSNREQLLSEALEDIKIKLLPPQDPSRPNPGMLTAAIEQIARIESVIPDVQELLKSDEFVEYCADYGITGTSEGALQKMVQSGLLAGGLPPALAAYATLTNLQKPLQDMREMLEAIKNTGSSPAPMATRLAEKAREIAQRRGADTDIQGLITQLEKDRSFEPVADKLKTVLKNRQFTTAAEVIEFIQTAETFDQVFEKLEKLLRKYNINPFVVMSQLRMLQATGTELFGENAAEAPPLNPDAGDAD